MKRVLLCGMCVWAVACGPDKPVTPSSPTAPSAPLPPSQPATFTLTGVVRDEAGTPLEGVTVSVGYDPRRAGFASRQTDGRGAYTLSGLFRGQQPFHASKSGYIHLSTTVMIGEETAKDVVMRPGVTIGGRIDEAGIGPLGGVTVTVVSGANAGMHGTSADWGPYSVGPILPGEVTLRATKPGYDSIERTVQATVNTYEVDFTLKWSYGTCLSSVNPVLVDRFPSAGGIVAVDVRANPERTWSSTTETEWIEMLTGNGKGPGIARFRVLPHPASAIQARSGDVMIRCSPSEAQRVAVTQLADCQTTVRWHPSSPQTFAAGGGTGRLIVQNGVAGCRSTDVSEVPWMTLAGAGSYMTGEVHFIVHPNATRAARTGTIAIGEARWQVTQQP